MAMLIDVDRETVKQVAIRLGHYKSGEGMRFSQVEKILAQFGVSSVRHEQSGDWRSLPDCALVSVLDMKGRKRAVIFSRQGGRSGHVYEGNPEPRATTGYRLVPGDPCLEIGRETGAAKESGRRGDDDSFASRHHDDDTFASRYYSV